MRDARPQVKYTAAAVRSSGGLSSPAGIAGIAESQPKPLEDFDERQHLLLIERPEDFHGQQAQLVEPARTVKEVASRLVKPRVKLEPVTDGNLKTALQSF